MRLTYGVFEPAGMPRTTHAAHHADLRAQHSPKLHHLIATLAVLEVQCGDVGGKALGRIAEARLELGDLQHDISEPLQATRALGVNLLDRLERASMVTRVVQRALI